MKNQLYVDSLPTSELPVSRLEGALSRQYLTNSYKLYWFLGLLDIVKTFPNENSINIEFEELVCRMVALSWYTLLEYKLDFGPSDKLKRAVLQIEEETTLTRNSTPEEIIKELRDSDDKNIKNQLKDFTRWVPYRFLSTFIDGLQGVPDHKKNSLIREASVDNPNVPYAIIGNTCVLDLRWLEYFYINLPILEGWAHMKLTDFLQSRNPNVPAISLKLKAPVKRELASARRYWSDYISANSEHDIFLGGLLRVSDLSIDHFIPWSFVLHDKLWNLVPTTREVNSSKSNHLPAWKDFFPGFAGIQYRSFRWHKKRGSASRLLEDYLLPGNYEIRSDLSEDSFRNLLEENLHPVYQIASNQGFLPWEVNV